MALMVRRSGTCSLIIDAGRKGARQWGVPRGGPADRTAWLLGNALVGNYAEEAALELTLHGPTLEATADHVLVVQGAPFVVKHLQRQIQEQLRVSPGHVFHVRAGDTISIHGIPEEIGLRAYLCVAGGFRNNALFHSRNELEPIQSGILLPCESNIGPTRRWMDTDDWPDAPTPGTLRLLPGTHATRKVREILETAEFKVRQESNRMGIRLTSDMSWIYDSKEQLSAPATPGTVQLPSGCQPIILGVDAQTIGGYPRLGHVINADLDSLGQVRPGERIRFKFVTLNQADELALNRRNWLQSWINRLRYSI